MNLMMQETPVHEKQMGIREIERMLTRSAHHTVVEVIAGCSSRREQMRLIDLWNHPEDFDDFLQQAAGSSCVYLE